MAPRPPVSWSARTAALSNDEPTIRGRVDNIETYLREHTTRLRPTEIPEKSDATFADYLDGKPGTIYQIETTAILLLRRSGVSARMVSGFTVTRRPGGAQEILAGSQISWPEVWYGPTVGWRAWVPASFVLFSTTDAEELQRKEDTARRDALLRRGLFVLGGLVVVGSLAFAVHRYRRFRRLRAEQTWAEKLLNQLETDGRERKQPRRANQTVLAYAGALGEGALPDPALRRVGEILSAELYAPASNPDDRAAAESILRGAIAAADAREKLKRRQRRLATLAALNPLSWPGRLRRSRGR